MTIKPKVISTPNPVMITNPTTGRYHVTTDSRSRYYVANRSLQLQRRIENELKYRHSMWTAFCCLTYDNDHLPVMEVQNKDILQTTLGRIKSADYLVPFNFDVVDDTDPSYIIPLSPSSAADIKSGRYAPNFTSPEHEYLRSNKIGVLNRRDITLFFKRFRQNVVRYLIKYYRRKAYIDFSNDTGIIIPIRESYDFSDPSQVDKYRYNYNHSYYKIKKDDKIFQRYLLLRKELLDVKSKAKSYYQTEFQSYTIGEYGGHDGYRSRPHYHILFFCSEEFAYELVKMFCFKSWQKCLPSKCTVELVRSSISSYISSYACSFSDYPSPLFKTKYKPFTRFSIKNHVFGSPQESLSSLIERFVQKDRKRILPLGQRSSNPLVDVVSKFDNKTKSFAFSDCVVSKNVLSRYFPLPHGYSRLSKSAKRDLFAKSKQILCGDKKLYPYVVKKSYLEAYLDSIRDGKFMRNFYNFNDCVVDNFSDCRALSGFINFVQSDFNQIRPLLHQYENLFDDLIETYIEILDWLYKQYNLYLNEVHINDLSDFRQLNGRDWIDQSMVIELVQNYSVLDFEPKKDVIVKSWNSGACGPFNGLFVRFLSCGIDLSDYYEVSLRKIPEFHTEIPTDCYYNSNLTLDDFRNCFVPTNVPTKARLKTDSFGVPTICRFLEDTSPLSRWTLQQMEKASNIKAHRGRHANSFCGTIND